MTIRQLEYVIKTVECGSITEAARQLYISQPSLSAAIHELEQEFGIEIFYRSSKGIALTDDGREFLSYAGRVTEQADALTRRYTGRTPKKRLCSVSSQHYSFAVEAFIKLVRETDSNEYDLTFRETSTAEIIDDVANMRSEVGILYLNDFNEVVMRRILREKKLAFEPLFTAYPHVFLSASHPLAHEEEIDTAQLDEYPCVVFEQGEYNSYYFSEEPFAQKSAAKCIHVSDRATLFNILIGLNGYTVCSGLLNSDLNGGIVPVKLKEHSSMRIGYIHAENAHLTSAALRYITLMAHGVRSHDA